MKKILLLFSICLIPMLGYAETDENSKERSILIISLVLVLSVIFWRKHCVIK